MKNRIINAIYAQAVADAVGNKFEFNLETINPDDVIAYANSSKKLVISDDTQMALFGFEAITEFNSREKNAPIPILIRESFIESYLDWYMTQTNTTWNHILYKDCLLSFMSMWSVQAPGDTCLNSLQNIRNGKFVVNDSKGCGSVMRLLPLVTLMQIMSSENAVRLAQITGAITHHHLENDTAIEYYINTAEAILHGLAFDSEFRGVKHISEIGSGWTALECVNMAIWAYCEAETFDDLLRLSIAHDGDSDSVAAIAGSLWGLSGGEVPQKYIDKLDALDAIQFTIDNLYIPDHRTIDNYRMGF